MICVFLSSNCFQVEEEKTVEDRPPKYFIKVYGMFFFEVPAGAFFDLNYVKKKVTTRKK